MIKTLEAEEIYTVYPKNGNIEAQGRLRQSDDLGEANLFFLDVAGKTPVEIKLSFKNMKQFEMPFHCGCPVTIQGTGSKNGDAIAMTLMTSLQPINGLQPSN